MTPNPVCYNGLSQPKASIHIGPVSLGITPKDYRADTAQKWRAGISPSTNIVLYSDTYSRAIDTQANAVPRIWWIDGTGSYTSKITELVSRLPDRSSLNYALLADYTAAVSWLRGSGTYSLINCDYPEYRFADYYTDCQTVANIESGYTGSYWGGGTVATYNLANPTGSVGFGTHAPAAFKVNDFSLTAGAAGVNPTGNGLGAEAGFTMNSGGITQTTATAAATYANGFVFEGIFGNLGINQTLFELWDTVSNQSIYQVTLKGTSIEVRDFNNTLSYNLETNMGLGQQSTYITFSHAPGATPTVQVDGNAQVSLTVNTPITWNTTTKWVVGAHLIGSTYNMQVPTVKAFKIHLASSTVTASFLKNRLHNNNYAIVSGMYAV